MIEEFYVKKSKKKSKKEKTLQEDNEALTVIISPSAVKMKQQQMLAGQGEDQYYNELPQSSEAVNMFTRNSFGQAANSEIPQKHINSLQEENKKELEAFNTIQVGATQELVKRESQNFEQPKALFPQIPEFDESINKAVPGADGQKTIQNYNNAKYEEINQIQINQNQGQTSPRSNLKKPKEKQKGKFDLISSIKKHAREQSLEKIHQLSQSHDSSSRQLEFAREKSVFSLDEDVKRKSTVSEPSLEEPDEYEDAHVMIDQRVNAVEYQKQRKVVPHEQVNKKIVLSSINESREQENLNSDGEQSREAIFQNKVKHKSTSKPIQILPSPEESQSQDITPKKERPQVGRTRSVDLFRRSSILQENQKKLKLNRATTCLSNGQSHDFGATMKAHYKNRNDQQHFDESASDTSKTEDDEFVEIMSPGYLGYLKKMKTIRKKLPEHGHGKAKIQDFVSPSSSEMNFEVTKENLDASANQELFKNNLKKQLTMTAAPKTFKDRLKEKMGIQVTKQMIFDKMISQNKKNIDKAFRKQKIEEKFRRMNTASITSFKNHQTLFDNLTDSTVIRTSKNSPKEHKVIYVAISYDSTRAISINKVSDREYYIQQYDLRCRHYSLCSQDIIGGQPDSYIKVKEIKQNSSGTKYCLVYIDDGKFRLRVFDKEQKSQEEVKQNELDINKVLKIDNQTVPVQNLDEPYISAAFMSDKLIFVALFHNQLMMHYHFMYSIAEKRIFRIRSKQMEEQPLNFPSKVFYSDEKNQVYIFYRQGQAFSINVKLVCSDRPSYKRRDSLNKLFEQQDKMDTQEKIVMDQVRKSFQSNFKRSPSNLPSEIFSDCEDEEIINPDNQNKLENMHYKFEQITDRDLGQMYLIYNKALVVRTSDSIMFFRQVYDNEKRNYCWKSYYQIDIQGTIYFIKGNQRIQITTQEKIYVYIIDYETLEPTLENVMFNFMECDQMMFGSQRRFCITYKKNEPNFEIRTRKYNNNFKIQIDQDNYEASKGLSIQSENVFIVSKKNKIFVYDSKDFQRIKTEENQDYFLELNLFQSETREPNQIISMAIDEKELQLAVLAGKNLIMQQQKPMQLYIFKIIKDRDLKSDPLFEEIKQVVIKDMEEFNNSVSSQFYFKLDAMDTLLFAQKNRIFSFNFLTEETETVCEFEDKLDCRPEFFQLNDTQTSFVVANENDGIFFNMTARIGNQLIDLDEKFEINHIKQIIYDIDDQAFYILSNKFKKKLGMYLIRFDEEDPSNYSFLINVKNKLEIGDASISVMRDQKKQFKELVVGFKTININTFNMVIIDISHYTCSAIQRVIFKTQTFQLWESKIMGFLINNSKDFITVSKDGINVVALGQIPQRAFYTDKTRVYNQLHSLESVNFLKIDSNNSVSFDMKGDSTIIQIENQYTKKVGQDEQTLYDLIHRIKIHNISLRELILIESINLCRTEGDIQSLLKNQPDAQMFFKSFLELNGSNMVSILAFDSRSMKVLLDENMNKDLFNSRSKNIEPIFYRNKLLKSNNKNKYFYQSAIDVAFKKDQIVAIELIINYIIKYQNYNTSAFLFFKNLNKLMNKGIDLSSLLGSEIFCYKIMFEEWPVTCEVNQDLIMPYNGSIFDIRHSYSKVFGDNKKKKIDLRGLTDMNLSQNIDKLLQGGLDEMILGDSNASKKVFKSSYTVNLLPMASKYAELVNKKFQKDILDLDEDIREGPQKYVIKQQKGHNLIESLSNTDNLSVFEQTSVLDLINFRWNTYGQKWHIVGLICHTIYMFTIGFYIYCLYVHDSTTYKYPALGMMILGIAYPFCYDSYQLYRLGWRNYFTNFWNYIDFSFIWIGQINLGLQLISQHHTFQNKLFQTIVLLLAIFKSFYFVRIFKNFSGIVVMLIRVFIELRVFIFFYFMLVFFFALIFMVIGPGNKDIKGKLRDDYLEAQEKGEEFSLPQAEYQVLGNFVGMILYVFRTSVGDFDFEGSTFLSDEENLLFFAMWTIITILTMIIFLNFIISEIGGIYNTAYEEKHQLVLKDKANLITESEQLMPKKWVDDQKFPKILIKRTIHNNS